MKPGSWRLVVCGTNHKLSSVEQREPLQIGADDMPAAGALFGSLDGVLESAIVATCNRVEFYLVTPRQADPFELVSAFYRKFRGLDAGANRELFRVARGKRAAEQLFRVSAGIDSMVLGENQILGQVKDAYRTACAVKSAGKVIHRLFHQAFRVGKQVRSSTELGNGACSVSTATVQMLERDLRARDHATVLFIGVNQMIRLAAKRIAALNGYDLVFANRTAKKAESIAAGVGGRGYGLDNLPSLLVEADFVISCTSSPQPVVTRDMLATAAPSRNGRRLVIADIAIPRDVDVPPDSGESLLVVRNLEDVKQFVKSGRRLRESAIPQAESIINRRLDEFNYWYGHVLHEPIYNGHSNTIESLREEELAGIRDKLSPELRNELDQATRRIVNRVIQIASRESTRKSE